MTDKLIARAEEGKYGDLFRLDLFWGAPNHPPIDVDLGDGFELTATNVSSYQGVRVWEVPALPGSAGEAKIDQVIAKTSTNRLVIFHDGDKQVWRWPSRTTRGSGVISRPARHVHKAGSNDPRFVAKLDAIRLPTDVQIDVNELLSRVRGAFDVETKNETKRASKLMAQMYAAVEKGYAPGVDPKRRDHEISVTLARVLFLLFGDDTEMWKDASGEPLPDLFQDFMKDHTDRDGTDIAVRLNALFRALDTAPRDRKGLAPELAAFPYVNGGIFDEKITLPDLDNDFRKAILDASAVDWSTISPAIFGSMFQSVRDAQTRRELGEHYTSEENILKTLNPLFLDELRAEFDAALARDTAQKRVNGLNVLWKKLGDIRYMDPACGCGNFIIVAYRELRDLELNIMGALADNQQGEDAATLDADWTNLLKVTLDHFYGIEIDEWPARIAETAMFLIDRQSDLKMKERFGIAPERLPIQKSATIVVGNALRLPWEQILPASQSVIVAGNPPFSGRHTRTKEQAADLAAAWEVKNAGHLDYVTAWYAIASRYLAGTEGEFAFVSTNSVTQGEPVALMFPRLLDAGWRIKFAHRAFGWTSEATGKATVHCVILGFTRRQDAKQRLFDYEWPLSAPREVPVTVDINPYLVDGPTIVVRKRAGLPLAPGLPEMGYGSMPNDGGHLLFGPEDVAKAKADPVALKYLRRYVGAAELIQGTERWCLWLVDLDPADLKHSALLKSRIDAVRAARLESKNPDTIERAATPHLFWFINQPQTAYLCVPQVFSENRAWVTAARLDHDVIANNRVYTCPDPDGFAFAVISSRMFLAWQKTVGGRLESRYNFSGTIVWNNFPLPVVDSGVRAKMIDAGRGILHARSLFPDRSLADLYEPGRVPAELAEAHEVLDEVADGLFGLSSDQRTEEARQSALFASFARIDAGLLADIKRTPARKRASMRA